MDLLTKFLRRTRCRICPLVPPLFDSSRQTYGGCFHYSSMSMLGPMSAKCADSPTTSPFESTNLKGFGSIFEAPPGKKRGCDLGCSAGLRRLPGRLRCRSGRGPNDREVKKENAKSLQIRSIRSTEKTWVFRHRTSQPTCLGSERKKPPADTNVVPI